MPRNKARHRWVCLYELTLSVATLLPARPGTGPYLGGTRPNGPDTGRFLPRFPRHPNIRCPKERGNAATGKTTNGNVNGILSKVLRRRPLGNQRWTRLEEAWRTILAAIAACGFVRLDSSRRAHREALRGLSRLSTWIVKTAALSGTEEVLRELKTWSARLRAHVVNSLPPHKRRRGFARYFQGVLRSLIDKDSRALQMSYIGRALPVGSFRETEGAIRKFREVTQVPFETHPDLLDSIRDWGAHWAARFLDTPAMPPLWRSSSGCVDFSRLQGGLAEAAVRAADFAAAEVESREDWDDLRNTAAEVPEMTDCDVDIAVREAQLRDVALTVAAHLPDLPPVEVCTVPERGMKCRIVTKAPWCLIHIGHFLRSWLFGGLRKDRRVQGVLAGDHAGALRGQTERVYSQKPTEEENICLSADLTAATDLFPQDLVAALVDGLLSGARKPPTAEIQEVFRKLTGPLNARLPDGDGFAIRRGIMMGFPTTWTLLNLVNLFWSETAWSASGSLPFQDVALSAQPAASPRTIVCGDDLASVWPPKVADRYEEVAEACGAKFSVGKHYRSRDYILFTEEIFKVSWEKQEYSLMDSAKPRRTTLADFFPVPRAPRKSTMRKRYRVQAKLAPVRCVPLRGLVRPLHAPKDRRLRPSWAALPAAVEAAMDLGAPVAVRRVLRVLHPGIWCWARKRGFSPTLPLVVGGYGLPPLRGSVRRVSLPKWLRYGLAAWLLNSKWKDLEGPSRCWEGVCRPVSWQTMAREHADVRIASSTFAVRKGRTPPPGFHLLGGLEAIQNLSVKFEGELCVLLGTEEGSLKRQFGLAPRRVANSLRKFFARMVSDHPSRRPFPSSLGRTALVQRWRSRAEERALYSTPRSAVEGLVLSLPVRAKRLLAEALGWV
ncbi:RNA-dependent RNA polymerase [Wenling narna-like virus 7]|uniref:RNA-dependent RNA polymerase n=1 Tax=Wenling narna-like virus 7 TaxID=1923507 RepID=UPI000909B31E|nr:RNA-dependent RNA polymerase [Wenling narna-like virus 7]APG77259.1 RNA-dependent RNA polymerase [Wenling narna-like virus 7]